MSTLESVSVVDQIGQTAGLVWLDLQENGPRSFSKLVKAVNAPRDTVMQAIGWLAREGKVQIKESKRSRLISLI